MPLFKWRWSVTNQVAEPDLGHWVRSMLGSRSLEFLYKNAIIQGNFST